MTCGTGKSRCETRGNPVSLEVVEVTPESDHHLAAVEHEAEAARPRTLAGIFDTVCVSAESFLEEGLRVRQFDTLQRFQHRSML